ncbi:MAG: hypothetical protein KME22_25215 [Hassallia sp. WJT32-NPBG1]|jgi:hypothetical protein|nr:hypothetical protein [Hassallia sp. WJT32-NPBG1]
MYLGETDNKYEIAEIALNQVAKNEVQLEEAKPNEVIMSDTAIAQGGGMIAFIFFCIGFLLMLSKMNKITLRNECISCSTNSHEKLPCRTCQYFSNNHHLKCAVQPSLVMTTEATTCSDYCRKSPIFPPKNKLKF